MAVGQLILQRLHLLGVVVVEQFVDDASDFP
jgi:hypothetical protein